MIFGMDVETVITGTSCNQQVLQSLKSNILGIIGIISITGNVYFTVNGTALIRHLTANVIEQDRCRVDPLRSDKYTYVWEGTRRAFYKCRDRQMDNQLFYSYER